LQYIITNNENTIENNENTIANNIEYTFIGECCGGEDGGGEGDGGGGEDGGGGGDGGGGDCDSEHPKDVSQVE
tara:strand:- start:708 stop:926 length:219 start_codon:yes stop_codon:yes gene_type:complete